MFLSQLVKEPTAKWGRVSRLSPSVRRMKNTTRTLYYRERGNKPSYKRKRLSFPSIKKSQFLNGDV